MLTRNKAAREDCLMYGMADKLSVGAALSALPGDRVEALVDACRRCVKPDDCILWMIDHANGAGTAPDYCLNAETLNQLRRTGG